MSKPLNDAVILVADDQADVVHTLCQPLRMAGATLRYVTNGHAALDEMAGHLADLILVDMKMPPGEWGGLWLIHELRNGGWTIPIVALSGEGSKRQVIEAQRLGANSWVDKDLAGEELLDQCVGLLADSFGRALDLASARLPTPLAHRFARYARMTDPDKRVIEGFHTLEAVLRFAALVGLSNTPPQALPGITAEKLRNPSMRTWFELCAVLARAAGAGQDFRRLFSFLVLRQAGHEQVSNFISLRNDIAHGRAIPDHLEGQRLDTLLRRFAHRAVSAWRADIAVPTCMTYDGSNHAVELLRFVGSGAPTPGSITSQTPLVTGQLVLLSLDGMALPLPPWLIARKDDRGQLYCLLFDGLQSFKRRLDNDTPFRYTKAHGGEERGPTPIPPGGTWQELAPWMSR